MAKNSDKDQAGISGRNDVSGHDTKDLGHLKELISDKYGETSENIAEAHRKADKER